MLRTIDEDDLEEKINQHKKELNQIAEATGLNSVDTLYCSQKLDQLITVYQRHLQQKEEKIPETGQSKTNHLKRDVRTGIMISWAELVTSLWFNPFGIVLDRFFFFDTEN